jgi:hypothetical protein
LAAAEQGGLPVEYTRRIERGARIITAIQHGVSVVLQVRQVRHHVCRMATDHMDVDAAW